MNWNPAGGTTPGRSLLAGAGERLHKKKLLKKL